MSQLSLLLQSRLQNLKQEKNRSQQWISEVKNHSSWEEIRAKDRREQIDNLVLLTYLFHVRPGNRSEECYGRVSKLTAILLSHDFRLSDYPESPEISRYPNAIVCVCGNCLELGCNFWALVKHCPSCLSKRPKGFFVPMFQDAMARTTVISREWAEWAQVQAILLRLKHLNRKTRTQTAIVSLSSENQDDGIN